LDLAQGGATGVANLFPHIILRKKESGRKKHGVSEVRRACPQSLERGRCRFRSPSAPLCSGRTSPNENTGTRSAWFSSATLTNPLRWRVSS
jgi:hypothetical protein